MFYNSMILVVSTGSKIPYITEVRMNLSYEAILNYLAAHNSQVSVKKEEESFANHLFLLRATAENPYALA